MSIFSLGSLRPLACALLVGALGTAPALAVDDVDQMDAAKKAWEEQKLPEKYGESQKMALEFLKGAAKDDSDKLMDVAITAASLGFPPAGVALGVVKGLFLSMKTTTDPVAEALKTLDRRITAAEAEISALQASVQSLRDDTLKIENRQRLRELDDRRRQLLKLRNRLNERPTGAAAKSLISDALSEADRFLAFGEPDDDMWYWSDIRVQTEPATGKLRASMLPKRFEPDLMLENYLQSLAVVVAAVESGGYDAAIRPRLERHVAFLTENPAAHASWPNPLPYRMEGRISCDTSVPSMQYPNKDGVCLNTIVCDEAFPTAAGHAVAERRPFLSKQVALPNQNLGDWCPKDMLVAYEPLIWDFHDRVGDAGVVARIQLMALAAQTLQQVGQVKDPSFDHSYSTPQYFYGVTAEGELVEYIHDIVLDLNPQKDPLDALGVQQKPGKVSDVIAQQAPPAPDAGLVVARPSGILKDSMIAKPPAETAGVAVQAPDVTKREAAIMVKPKPVIHQKLTGPFPVRTGWSGGAKGYAGGVYGTGAALYVVTPDGVMNWVRHDNYRGGKSQWTQPIPVGTGWNGYARLFAGGDGVVYGIDPAQDLYWYRQLDVANASATPKWNGRTKVGNGWGHFVSVFAGGEGVVYAVHPDGRLLWYRHTGYLTGAPTWEGPKEVGTGWSHFRALFATGEGRIYAVQPNGDLYFYQHTGYKTGDPTWEPYTVLGKGFDRFSALFPVMWGTEPEFQGPK